MPRPSAKTNHNRQIQRLDRTLSCLLGEIKPRPLVERIDSPTGRTSKCAEVRSRIEPVR